MHLEQAVHIGGRGGNLGNHHLKKRFEVGAGLMIIQGGCSIPGFGVDDGEVQLPVGGIQLHKEVKDFIEDLIWPSVGAVNFIDDNDNAQVSLQGFAQDKLGLSHGALKGIH